MKKGFSESVDKVQGTPDFLEEQFKDGKRLRSSSINSSGRALSGKFAELEVGQVKKFNWTLIEMEEDSMIV